MGHTHSWKTTRTLTKVEIESFRYIFKLLVRKSNVPLDVDITNRSLTYLVEFNGEGDDAYEDFTMLTSAQNFNFCKTNHKPYDLVVTATLIAAAALLPDWIKLDSDGDFKDWIAGYELVRAVVPKLTTEFNLIVNNEDYTSLYNNLALYSS